MTNRLPPASVFGSEVLMLSSSLTGQAYQLAVWLPPSYAASSQSYPVLYLLDGDLLFDAATQIITPLIWGQELPELIVVGIGYGMCSYEEWGSRRRQELTPTQAAHGAAAGGAPELLTFLETEVIPLIDAKYRTAPHRVLRSCITAAEAYQGEIVGEYVDPNTSRAPTAALPATRHPRGGDGSD